MPRDTEDTGSRSVPRPDDALTDLLARAHAAVRAGEGPSRALPSGSARLFGLHAFTLNAVTRDGRPELLWADPPQGLGIDLDTLQYTLGDGPTLQAAREGRTVTEPDLHAAHPARWPLFLPAAARTPARTIVALPLQIGATTAGVLTGYRTTPGPLTPACLDALHGLAQILLLALVTQFGDPTGDTPPGTDLRLYRAEVHQATGYLAAALDIPIDQALLRLRAHAAAHGQLLPDLARSFLTRRLSPDALHR
ncbi:GAF and ANTAR domain-containing protein [Streptomyces sp. NPDC001351]|uniref:GAF and ANTAR domain-containing protein n=1 Tax=Streptomyces sp. NPDC001351 TaxID=3364564 RepID=UPI0036AFC299